MIFMKTSDFYYDLPPELIAQTPLERRDGSRLLTLDKRTGETGHGHFYDLPRLLRPGDCLVMNDSRVLPARWDAGSPPAGRQRCCCWWIGAIRCGSAWSGPGGR